jgi:hypothetical protein
VIIQPDNFTGKFFKNNFGPGFFKTKTKKNILQMMPSKIFSGPCPEK